MNRFVLALVLCGPAAAAVPAAAQQAPQQAYAAPTPAPNQFTDPAMSFIAPAGYYKANIPAHDPTDFDQPTVVAAFANRGATRVISIQMETFTGSLSGFEMVTENEMRNATDGVFFKKKEQTTLSNGMPAYWQEITVGSGFQTAKRFQYAWIDGVRGVVLSITGRYGEITEDEAKKALANASAVAYPRNRY
ncbi:MAG TPA: hypothetical protein VJP85_05465 [Candidatus Baltobacteraceae bacterium]|nr:hypothetical protein [Candidatus Baltobacteraceae bacterium]